MNYSLEFKGKYTRHIYNFISQHEINEPFEITLKEIKKDLGELPPSYTKYSLFKANVLARAYDEITKLTDLEYDYVEVLENRRVEKVQFTVYKLGIRNSVKKLAENKCKNEHENDSKKQLEKRGKNMIEKQAEYRTEKSGEIKGENKVENGAEKDIKRIPKNDMQKVIISEVKRVFKNELITDEECIELFKVGNCDIEKIEKFVLLLEEYKVENTNKLIKMINDTLIS